MSRRRLATLDTAEDASWVQVFADAVNAGASDRAADREAEGTDNLIHQAEVALGDEVSPPSTIATIGVDLKPARPVIVTVSGGVADIAANPAGLPVYLLDYDDLKCAIEEGLGIGDNGPIDLAPECLAFIREHDDAGFVAKVNARVRHPFTTADRLPNAPNKCDSCGQSTAASVHDYLWAGGAQ